MYAPGYGYGPASSSTSSGSPLPYNPNGGPPPPTPPTQPHHPHQQTQPQQQQQQQQHQQHMIYNSQQYAAGPGPGLPPSSYPGQPGPSLGGNAGAMGMVQNNGMAHMAGGQ
ncbi:hypothetical protein BUE80_DR012518, partial [Diplocarpon rosae]